jgi:hypothetical protein
MVGHLTSAAFTVGARSGGCGTHSRLHDPLTNLVRSHDIPLIHDLLGARNFNRLSEKPVVLRKV